MEYNQNFVGPSPTSINATTQKKKNLTSEDSVRELDAISKLNEKTKGKLDLNQGPKMTTFHVKGNVIVAA